MRSKDLIVGVKKLLPLRSVKSDKQLKSSEFWTGTSIAHKKTKGLRKYRRYLLLYSNIVYTSLMKFFRRTQKQTLLIWTVLLSVSILCSQGVKLHVHGFDHDHQSHHHDQLDAGDSDHLHLNEIHFASDETHIDHHGGVIQELDISQESLLKKISNVVLTLAFVAAFFFLLLPGLARWTYQRRRDPTLTLPHRYLHSPPLRAPPQY